MLLTDFPAGLKSGRTTFEYEATRTYRIVGGVPAGTSICPGEDGCRKNSTHMSMMTMHGKRTTMLRGMERLELPLRRIRRLKKASRGDRRSVCLEKSFSVGNGGGEGMRFVRVCRRPIRAGQTCRLLPERALDRRAGPRSSRATRLCR